MPDRTDLTEVTHNTWVDPAAITVIRFRAAPLGKGKDRPPCPTGMMLEAWAGPVQVEVTWFDSHNSKAFTAAQERMRELIQRVDAAKRRHG